MYRKSQYIIMHFREILIVHLKSALILIKTKLNLFWDYYINNVKILGLILNCIKIHIIEVVVKSE